MNENQYFASNENVEELAGDILKRMEDYTEYVMTSGKAALWAKSYDTYYSGAIKLGEIEYGGEHNEFMLVTVNHYKSLLNNIHTMTTGQKISLDPRAINTDTESTAQAKLATGLLDYYMREKKVEIYIKRAVKLGLLYGEGFVTTEWDTTGGEEYGVNPETQAIIREGDLSFSTLPPHFVARDFTKYDSERHDWYILTRFENKFNLAAKYPEQEELILDLSLKEEDFIKLSIAKAAYTETDDIPVYTFYHKPTEALPEGRMVTVLSTELVLFDGPIPYRDLPVHRLTPEDEDFSIFGYTVAYDLLSIQDAINSLYSTVATNQSTFGVQSILVPVGFQVSVESLASGLNLIHYDPNIGTPEPLQLTLTAPEIFNFIQQLETLMETLSAVNSVARGNPEASLKSGAALALVQSQAIQFNMGLQQSYTNLLETVGSSMIKILQDFASVPRVAMISGKYNKSYMKEFSGKDLEQISRVVVDSGNPLAKTMAGKIQMADALLDKGFIKNPEQYEQVLATGNIDYMIEGDQKELYNIRAENEGLAAGEEQIVMKTDSHAMHIKEHKAVLSSPESRVDPDIVGAVTLHIEEHIHFLKTTDPALLMILGQQPISGMGEPGLLGDAPVGSIPAVEGMPTDIGAEQMPTEMQPGVMNPTTAEAAKVNLPNMPSPPQGADPRSAAIIEGQKAGPV